MRAIVGSNFYYLLNSKSPLICIFGKHQKFHKTRSLNYCFKANQRVLFFAKPFLSYKGFALMGHLKTAKCECLWSSAEHTAEAVTCRGKNIFVLKEKSSNLYIIMFEVSENVSDYAFMHTAATCVHKCFPREGHLKSAKNDCLSNSVENTGEAVTCSLH